MGIMMSTILTSATGWMFWAVATARWSPGQIGVSTSLIAALTTIALIAGQPISTTMLLRIPRSENRGRLLNAGLLLTTGIGFAASLVAIFVLPESLRTIRTFGVAALFTIGASAVAASMVLDSSALAIRRPQLMVARNVMHGAGKLLLLAAVAVPAGLVSGPVAIVGTWATFSVAACIWEWRKWSQAVRSDALTAGSVAVPRDRTAPSAAWNDLRRGFGLQVVGTLGGTLPTQVLPVVVITILGSVRAGWFSITWQMGGLCFMISPSVCATLLAEGSLRPDQLMAKTRAAVVLSSGLLAVPLLVYIFGGHFVLGLFGHSYAEHGTALLTILVISSIPDLITNVAVARFRVQDRLAASAVVNGLIAVVSLSGAIWLMPHLGINGAGWAWAGGEVAGCFALLGITAARGFRPVTPSGIGSTSTARP
jgi:O-antigen/teichoic acid export membrane protein